MSSEKGISSLLYTFLLSIVGLAISPTIADSVETAITALGVGTASTILALFPLFWILMMIGIPIGAVYMYMKD